MPGASSSRTRVRRAVAWLALAGGLALWFVIYGGRVLQREDPLEHADAIFVLAGSRMERPLEGLDLYKEGWAPLIVLSPGRPEPAEAIARSRGTTLPSESAAARDTLVKLGASA